jgi:hypothetical protein
MMRDRPVRTAPRALSADVFDDSQAAGDGAESLLHACRRLVLEVRECAECDACVCVRARAYVARVNGV